MKYLKYMLLVAMTVLGGLVLSFSKLSGGSTEAIAATVTIAPDKTTVANNSMQMEKSLNYLNEFGSLVTQIHEHYIYNTTNKDLFIGALKGMVGSLDPHSEYFTEDDYKKFYEDVSGKYQGIGISLSVMNNQLTVSTAFDGSPAQKAGVQSGDIIVEIDGVDSTTMSSDQAVKKMRGEKGTSVKIGVRRKNEPKILYFTITRNEISQPSVTARQLENGIYYIRVSSFQMDSGDQFIDVIKKLDKDHPKGYILDLRNNPGGSVTSAITIASVFLKDHQNVVYTLDKHSKKDDYGVVHTAVKVDKPLVVLVNTSSASASEIVTGALQDNGRAIVVGETTFGKGLVQTTLPVSSKTLVKLTTYRYYTPNGNSIQNIGIIPDVPVKAGRVENATTDNLTVDFYASNSNVTENQRLLTLDYQLYTAYNIAVGLVVSSNFGRKVAVK